MSDLDFYVHFAAHGEVLGLGLGARLDDWTEKFGGDFFEGQLCWGQLGRQYGAIEPTFVESSGGWETNSVSVKVHKLAWGDGFQLPSARNTGTSAPLSSSIRSRIGWQRRESPCTGSFTRSSRA